MAILVFQVITYFIILKFLNPPFFYTILVFCISSLVMSFNLRMYAMSVLNFLSVGILGLPFFDLTYRYNRLVSHAKKSIDNFLSFHVYSIQILAFAFSVWVASVLYRKLTIKNPFLRLMALLLVVVVFIMATVCSQNFYAINLFFWSCSILLAKYFGIILYSLRSENEIEEKYTFGKFATFFPFWSVLSSYHIHNIPRGYQEMKSIKFLERKLAVNRSLKCILIAFLLAVLAHITWAIVFDKPAHYSLRWLTIESIFKYPSIYSIGLRDFNNLSLSRAEIWIVSLSYGIAFLIKNASVMFMIVSAIQMAGFNVQAPVHNIQKSQNFSDFMARYYYYYGDLLKSFFYFPALLFVDRYRIPPWLKKFLASFFCVFFGGCIVHFIIEIYRELETNSISNAIFYVGLFSPYLFALAVLISFSQALPSKFSKKSYVKFILLLIFACLYAFCFSLQFYFASKKMKFDVNLNDMLIFLKSLFL